MDKNLKITLIIIGVILVGLFAFLVNPNEETKKSTDDMDSDQIIEQAQKDSESAQESGSMKEFNNIKIDDYLSYLKGNENKMLLVARPTCTYCQIAEPILQNISYEYDIVIDYLNTDDFSDDDTSTFVTSAEEFKEGFGTPILLVVSNDKVVDMVDGLTTKDEYIKFMSKYNFIKSEE